MGEVCDGGFGELGFDVHFGIVEESFAFGVAWAFWDVFYYHQEGAVVWAELEDFWGYVGCFKQLLGCLRYAHG